MKDKNKSLVKVALLVFALAVVVVLLFSCLSFDTGDFPSKYVWPNNDPAENWCGKAGAFASFYLMYYVGPGVFVALAAIAVGITWRLCGKEVNQIILRLVGIILTATAISSIIYMIRPYPIGALPIGSGGILGTGIVVYLKTNFSLLGSVIIVISSLVVGSILLADTLVIVSLHALGAMFARLFGLVAPAWYAARQQSKALTDIWQKLNAKRVEIEAEAQDAIEVEEAQEADEEIEEDTELQPTVAELMAQEAEQIEKLQNRKQAKPVLEPEYEEEEIESQGDEEIETHLEKKPVMPAPVKKPQAKPEPVYEVEALGEYLMPDLDLLIEPEYNFGEVQEKLIKAKSAALEKVLNEFGIEANVVGADPGPTITMFELALAPGVKVSQISNLSNDVARAMGAPAVRVVAPLPGRHTIGIDVPNSQKETVRMKDLLVRAGETYRKMQIPLFLGKDSSGQALVSDLASMPHLLIAGTTGSGKSVCINSIVMSIMLTKRPDEVKLILVDPKMVEMTAFAKIPHLMAPIVTEVSRAEQILEWATMKMDERYSLLAEAGVRNIAGYNALGAEEVVRRFNPQTPEEEARIPKKLPYFVIIVDELADLMMTASKEIEGFIVRLAQKSRAVGIHIILATQRPQATVVTGLIKSNLPSRISFRVASRMDSRIVLDQNGAETLLGQGDMLFLKPGTSDLVRAQGAYVDDSEIKKVVTHLIEQAEPQFHPELMQLNKIDTAEACQDDMFDDAVRIVLESKRGSVSLLQRKLSVGYARASRMIEAMATCGILGAYKGSQAREVMMTLEEYDNAKAYMAIDKQTGFSDMQEDSPVEEYNESEENEEELIENAPARPSSHQIKDVEYDDEEVDEQSLTNS